MITADAHNVSTCLRFQRCVPRAKDASKDRRPLAFETCFRTSRFKSAKNGSSNTGVSADRNQLWLSLWSSASQLQRLHHSRWEVSRSAMPVDRSPSTYSGISFSTRLQFITSSSLRPHFTVVRVLRARSLNFLIFARAELM